MKRKGLVVLNIVLLVAITVTFVFYALNKELAPAIAGVGEGADGQLEMTTTGLIISEVMIANEGAVMDDDGEYPDWVELYNGTAAAINLSGYALSDRSDNPAKFPLPSMELGSGEYLVVYLSGKSRNAASAPLHASFKLKAGETLYLFNGSSLADQVELPQTAVNSSYIHQETGFEETTLYSPGYPNTQEGHDSYLASFDRRAQSSLKINEVQSSNASTLADENGAYPDWIELINLGTETIDLSGYALTDDDNEPMQWRFASGSIAPGEMLVVYCDNQNSQDGQTFHTNFAISASGENISLRDAQGYLLDRVELPELKDDCSYARQEDGGYQETNAPTPGLANTAENGLSVLDDFFRLNNGGVYISEVLSSAGETMVNDQAVDYAEIVNNSGQTVNLGGWGLSNNPDRTRRFEFPELSLAPGERVVVALTGEDSTETGKLSASFRASSTGEILYLFDAQDQMVDKLLVPALQTDISYGRGDDLGLFYYATPSPGQPNQGESYVGVAQEVSLSLAPGLYDEGLSLELSVSDGSQIYYTTDCTEPSASSTPYTGPIQLSSTTVVRAVAVKEGYLSPLSTTGTYIIGESHSVRVVCLSTDPDNLFSDEKGIYADGPGYQEEFPHGSPGYGANFWMDWERPVYVEIFDEDGTTLLSQGAEFKINGQYSRALDQKSFAVYARKEYGESRFNAALFDDRDYDSYKSFVLRCTAQDYNRARMRDAMMTSLMEGQGVMYQETEVCVLYINGEYWGHYNMRERVNKWSIAQWEGVTDETAIDNIDLLKGNGNVAARVLNGTNEEYMELIDFVESHSLKDEENLKYVTDRVDIINYFDYQIAEIFWVNSDNGNIKYYKVPGGKWKWILYDLDWGINTGETNGYKRDGFLHVLNENGTGYNDSFNNSLIRGLLENPEMEELFIERCAYYVREVYTKENIYAAIEELESQMAPEMEAHYERWPDHGSVQSWQRHVNRLREFADNRTGYMMQHMKDWFGLSDEKMTELFGELWQG